MTTTNPARLKQEAIYLLMDLAGRIGTENDKRLRGATPDPARLARLYHARDRARARLGRRCAALAAADRPGPSVRDP